MEAIRRKEDDLSAVVKYGFVAFLLLSLIGSPFSEIAQISAYPFKEQKLSCARECPHDGRVLKKVTMEYLSAASPSETIQLKMWVETGGSGMYSPVLRVISDIFQQRARIHIWYLLPRT